MIWWSPLDSSCLPACVCVLAHGLAPALKQWTVKAWSRSYFLARLGSRSLRDPSIIRLAVLLVAFCNGSSIYVELRRRQSCWSDYLLSWEYKGLLSLSTVISKLSWHEPGYRTQQQKQKVESRRHQKSTLLYVVVIPTQHRCASDQFFFRKRLVLPSSWWHALNSFPSSSPFCYSKRQTMSTLKLPIAV